MKAKYEAPTMIQVELHSKRHLLTASQTGQDVYTDDPQSVDRALIKEQSSGSIWDNEW